VTTSHVSLAAAMRDPNLLGRPFLAESFWPWHCVAKILSDEALDDREAALFRSCTGRTKLPAGPIRRLVLLAGRRAGKDRFASAVAVYEAALGGDWQGVMSAGEQAVVLLIGADKKQARILRRYCAGLLRNPLLAAEVVRDTDDAIEFRNGAALEVATNDASLIRGRSAIAVIGSECCHWRTSDASSSSDEEVVGAAEPSLAMTPGGGLMLLQSSVHRRIGYMARRSRELHGNDDADDVCWLADSRTMNPALPASVVEKALADDPARARAEFLSIWREDLASYVDVELIEHAVDTGVLVRPPRPGVRYVAFTDAASGTGKDAFSVGIAHAEGRGAVLDLAHEIKPPFSPDNAIAEIAALLKGYNVHTVTGDKYSAGFVIEGFSRQGIRYTYSDRDRSAIYVDCLPLFTAGRVSLIDNKRLVTQFASLERRTGAGRDRIDHPRDAHDDLANAVAGALTLAAGTGKLGLRISPEALRMAEMATAF
jgi:hypothetical protein